MYSVREQMLREMKQRFPFACEEEIEDFCYDPSEDDTEETFIWMVPQNDQFYQAQA